MNALAMPASRLTLEIALSRVNVAALKVHERQTPTQTEKDSARDLVDILRRDLETLRGHEPIRPDAVPNNAMRRSLEKALETLTRPSGPRLVADVSVLQKLLDLVGALASERGLTRSRAGELLNLLAQVERFRERRAPPIDLEDVRRLERRS